MIIFSYFFLLFLTIILGSKTIIVLHTDYSYKRNHIVPHKDRFSLIALLGIFFYSIFLFSNASIFDSEEDPDYIILNFLYISSLLVRAIPPSPVVIIFTG